MHILDAKNKSLGRLASEVAVLLRGKNKASFAPYLLSALKVKVINIGAIKISEKKANQKTYRRYSGYPGGLKITPLKSVLEKKGPAYVLRKAVEGMLPKNKLRAKMIKNLIIE